ncbi:glycosyltransferase [Morganella morganii]
MSDDKLISVIMASNKIDNYLYDAVQSILLQSYKSIELIFVANGPNSSDIFKYLNHKFSDPRLKIIETPIAQLSFSLNLGISISKGEYIARMDADDLSQPERLHKQLSYMLDNNLDMVASDLLLINANGDPIGVRRYPKKIDNINKQLPYRNTFAHNTVLIKKVFILKARGYNSGFNSEDYDLWLRLKRHNINWDNMSECILKYRIHDESTQRKRLGYAESAGYSLREMLLKFSFTKFLAVIFHIIKSYARSK